MLINGTMLSVAPIRVSVLIVILIVSTILALLFTAVRPEVSAELSLIPRFFFWLLHIASGMLGIVLASYVIRLFSDKTLPIFITIGLTGLAGAIIISPLYVLIDVIYPQGDPDDWLDHFAMEGWWQSLVAELVEVLPMFLMSWCVLNLPLLLNKTLLNNGSPPPDDPDTPDEEEAQQLVRKQHLDQLYEGLPKAIGNSIVAISSDLHYLNVHTTLGKTLILGSLKHYVEAFGDAGMLVHRSHWVAKEHLVKAHITGNKAYCLMSTGLKVPISRSKRKDVKTFLGQGTVAQTSSSQPKLMRVK